MIRYSDENYSSILVIFMFLFLDFDIKFKYLKNSLDVFYF